MLLRRFWKAEKAQDMTLLERTGSTASWSGIVMSFSKPLDTVCAHALNPTIVCHWFNEVVKKQYLDRRILPKNSYGMDESGFPPEASHTRQVVWRQGTKTQHKQGTANWENVTALVMICADGTVLRPTIIFKGKNFVKSWRNDNVAQALYVLSMMHM
jgi:hypothetical protein